MNNKNKNVEVYYRANYPYLIKIARRRVGNYSLALAEEAVQEAFCRSLKYYATYNPSDSFEHWFKKILYNTINQLKSDEMNGGVTYTEEHEEAQHHPSDVPFSKEIVDLLNKTSPRDLEILNNYFFLGFKSREISELMNISHDVVRDRIRTFRERART